MFIRFGQGNSRNLHQKIMCAFLTGPNNRELGVLKLHRDKIDNREPDERGFGISDFLRLKVML